MKKKNKTSIDFKFSSLYFNIILNFNIQNNFLILQFIPNYIKSLFLSFFLFLSKYNIHFILRRNKERKKVKLFKIREKIAK
jgi:hypothetical protein